MKGFLLIIAVAAFLGTAAGMEPLTNVPSSERPILVMRTFQVDTKVFLHNLWNEAKTNEFQEHVILKSYLKRNGVEISPPSAIFFNERTGTLYVRSTETNIQKLAPLVAALSEKK